MQTSDDKDIRAIEIANHIIKTKDTVRKTATIFGISKSTVHTVVIKQNYFLYV